jgi:hypothetical protein
MHVAHVVPTYPPYRGGVGHLAAEYATRLRARGHRVEADFRWAPAIVRLEQTYRDARITPYGRHIGR